MRCYFFLPVAYSQVRSRFTSILGVLDALDRNIRQASSLISEFHVHVHLNGSQPRGIELGRYLRALSRGSDLPVLITSGEVADKIVAVNTGLELAREAECHVFFCVDNDIVIPQTAVFRMLDIIKRSRCDGVVCEKAPLVTERSNAFQVEYSRFIELALAFQVFPNRRPTGSFYCIDPLRVSAFPLGSNEGDVLTRFNIIHTNTFVYSEYPRSVDAEILRRRRIETASKTLGYVRDIQSMEFVEYVERHPPFPASVQGDEFRRSFRLYKYVVASIQEERLAANDLEGWR